MSTPSLPPVSSLPTADDETLLAVLDTLFEPAPEMHALALPALRSPPPSDAAAARPDEPLTSSYRSLIFRVAASMFQLASASSAPGPERTQLHGILGSHPRLGAPRVTSAQSRAEQAQLNNSSSSSAGSADSGAEKKKDQEEEARRLAALNAEYEAAFPGLRYVVFVNGRGRPEVMADMRRRIDRGDVRAEEREAIQVSI
ncbi:Oxo-4-hydroxy-4-carboxy-5-ureidoimidazoline decarboxylase [Xylariaceae sp. FL0804]|nr:Oxo-4-hydroxy-4-carboxy-5-ureidoimidazoline decarboxylase [Xylariaceae sp. FL0804]